ncbi:MAG: peroxidase-related enzyme [Rhizobiales bacterium]|nr:peroxidase-related enzyme [Hyphomicrobiales bacterium]
MVALTLPDGNLNEHQEQYFQVCEEKLGFVPNVLTAYSFDSAKLDGFTGLYNDLMMADSGLSKLDREIIAVAVSSVNKCYYCLVAHSASVRKLSGNAILGEQMVMNFRTADLDRRQLAMCEFAVKLTEIPAKVVESDRQSLREAGFSDRDIWDIAAVASFFNMSNHMAIATDMQPNDEYHTMAR